MTGFVRGAIPDTPFSIELPDDWQVTVPEGLALAAAGPIAEHFATNLTVVVDTTATTPPPASLAASLDSVAMPVLIDARALDGELSGFDALFAHVFASMSVTVRQRQVSDSGGVVVLTFSAATSTWPEVGTLAERVLASLRRN